MEEIALAKIKTFASQPEAVHLLTSSQVDSIMALLEAQGSTISRLEKELYQLREEVALERARDRQRISSLEREEAQPLQRDRGEILRALLAANGGKMLAKEARQKMHLSKQAFTNLLATIEEIESKPLRTDKRQRLLVLE